jgi:hypothetical protein
MEKLSTLPKIEAAVPLILHAVEAKITLNHTIVLQLEDVYGYRS